MSAPFINILSMRSSSLIRLTSLAIVSITLLLSDFEVPHFLRAEETPTVPTVGEEWHSDEYGSVLENVDGSGLVNYRRLKANRAALDRFALQLAGLSEPVYQSWDERTKISFWVNAYNGLTLLAIIDHYPIKASFLGSLWFPGNSIRQISGVWDRLGFRIMGAPKTLDQIEHEILRNSFDEPRIHVALVCAARGCPPLRNEPYEGARLDKQLDDQARLFFGNPTKFRINRQTNTVYLSSILDWYGEDFVKRYSGSEGFKQYSLREGAVLKFASNYLPLADAEYLMNASYDVSYLEYDWSLNEQNPE